MSGIKPIWHEFKETFRAITVAVEAASIGRAIERDPMRRASTAERIEFSIEHLARMERDAMGFQRDLAPIVAGIMKGIAEASGNGFIQAVPLEIPKGIDVHALKIGRLTVYCDASNPMLPFGARFVIPVERVSVEMFDRPYKEAQA